MKRDVRVERRISMPPGEVWITLTDSGRLSRWLMESDFKPSVGRTFQFRGDLIPGWTGMVKGRVLEVDPPRKLVYTWKGSSDGNKGETVVSWTLEPTEGGTRLLLEQTGFQGLSGAFASWILELGWKKRLSSDLFRSGFRT